MADQDNPFTGTWNFNPHKSKLDTPLPRKWVQVIVATQDEIVVREEVERPFGPHTHVYIWARFDGTDFPVTGLSMADCIAYNRVNRHSIAATGKKNGVVTLTQTLTVASNGQVMTLIYSIQTGASQAARGIAVFDKAK